MNVSFGKRIFFAAILLLSNAALAEDTAREIHLVQDNAYPPYMSKEGNRAVGIYADIVRTAMERMEASNVKLQAIPWTRAVGLVRLGLAEGLVGTYYKPQARPWIRIYSEALLQEHVSVYCQTGLADPNWMFPEDFEGLIFGNNTGFQTPGDAFFAMVDDRRIILEQTPTTRQNLHKLSLGRIDCYVQERLAVDRVLNETPLTGFERVVDVSVESAHIGYSQDFSGPAADNFIKIMDDTLRAMKKDGTVERIVNTYIQE